MTTMPHISSKNRTRCRTGPIQTKILSATHPIRICADFSNKKPLPNAIIWQHSKYIYYWVQMPGFPFDRKDSRNFWFIFHCVKLMMQPTHIKNLRRPILSQVVVYLKLPLVRPQLKNDIISTRLLLLALR